MQNKWSIEMIAELAFVQEPIRFYGYGMDKGIILIADDEEGALAIKLMLEAHMDAVGVKLRGRKENQPLNYQMGVHVYNRLDDERKVIDFLEEQEFLPIIVASGMIPEILIGRGYAFRCTATEKDFIEVEKWYKSFKDFTKRNASVVCDLIKQISKCMDMLEDSHKKYQKYCIGYAVNRWIRKRYQSSTGSNSSPFVFQAGANRWKESGFSNRCK